MVRLEKILKQFSYFSKCDIKFRDMKLFAAMQHPASSAQLHVFPQAAMASDRRPL
jgi:hypothetical protein